MTTITTTKKNGLLLSACLTAAGALLGAAAPARAWDLPVYLSDPGAYLFGDTTRLAVDGKGRAVVAWMRSDGADQRVEIATRPAGGSFGAATWLSGAGA